MSAKGVCVFLLAFALTTECAGGRAPEPAGDRASGGDVVYFVCTDVQTEKFQAQGHGDQSQAMAQLLCQIAAGGCRENASQEGCKNTLCESDVHLKAPGSSMLFEVPLHRGEEHLRHARAHLAGHRPGRRLAPGAEPECGAGDARLVITGPAGPRHSS